MIAPRRRVTVIKLTGSLFEPENSKLLEEYLGLLDYLQRLGFRAVLVTGGGPVARQYISMGRQLGLDECFLDELGIVVARLNAKLLTGAMLRKGLSVYPGVPRSTEELRLAFFGSNFSFYVFTGLQPGHSSDTVAALAAETVGAKLLIVATKVDGVYSSDGKILPEITIDELKKILENNKSKAGTYELFDKLAIEIVKRSRINVIFMNFQKPWQLVKILKGEPVGTLVRV